MITRPVFLAACVAACCLNAPSRAQAPTEVPPVVAARAEAASDSRLPDGNEFTFWEQPLTFTRTYYVDGSSPRSDDRGPGTLTRPFRTIGRAAELLEPGERVVIAAGTYLECIRPARGGTGPDKMISYEAAPGAQVIVKGSGCCTRAKC